MSVWRAGGIAIGILFGAGSSTAAAVDSLPCHATHYCGICHCWVLFRNSPPTEIPVIQGTAPKSCVCPFSRDIAADNRCGPADFARYGGGGGAGPGPLRGGGRGRFLALPFAAPGGGTAPFFAPFEIGSGSTAPAQVPAAPDASAYWSPDSAGTYVSSPKRAPTAANVAPVAGGAPAAEENVVDIDISSIPKEISFGASAPQEAPPPPQHPHVHIVPALPNAPEPPPAQPQKPLL